jgi:hypothetical protein
MEMQKQGEMLAQIAAGENRKKQSTNFKGCSVKSGNCPVVMRPIGMWTSLKCPLIQRVLFRGESFFPDLFALTSGGRIHSVLGIVCQDL